MLYFLFVFAVLIFIIDQCRPKNLVRLHRQLGVDWLYIPIIGHGYKFFGNNEDIQKTIQGARTQFYKRKHGILSLWLGFKFVIATGDPVQAIGILKTAFEKSFFNRFVYFFLGNGIIFSSSKNWQRRRKILAPTFAPRNVQKFVRIFEANAKIVVNQMQLRVGNGNFSCWQYICHYGLDSVCETILDLKLGALNESDHFFPKAFKEIIQNVVHRLYNPFLYNDFIYRLMPVYRRQKELKRILHKFIDDIILKKIDEISKDGFTNESENDTYKYKSFLQLMVESSKENDKKYTYEELREEVIALVLAGTDTSATALSFTLLLLSQNQDVQDKVYNELEKVFSDPNQAISYENLNKLKYTDAVIKEILRLYPPIPIISRDSEKDFVLPCGLAVPSKCEVSVNIFSIQRNPNYWGDDAEVFKPERFLSETTLAPGAFMAFSYGPRNCPGQLYAMISIKTTLVTILRRYRLLPATSFKFDKDHPIRISYEIMTKHVDNFDIQIENRHPSKSESCQ